MTIYEFIQKEAPRQMEEYIKELQNAYDKFKDMNRIQLEQELEYAREDYKLYKRSLNNTARCMVIYALINENLR
jgi:plasmid stabilization system protein ParE